MVKELRYEAVLLKDENSFTKLVNKDTKVLAPINISTGIPWGTYGRTVKTHKRNELIELGEQFIKDGGYSVIIRRLKDNTICCRITKDTTFHYEEDFRSNVIKEYLRKISGNYNVFSIEQNDNDLNPVIVINDKGNKIRKQINTQYCDELLTELENVLPYVVDKIIVKNIESPMCWYKYDNSGYIRISFGLH